MIHSIDLGRIQKPLHVFPESKDGGAALRGVTPDTFKNAGTIMKNMRHHVHARVVPFDEFAVMPHDVANSRSAYVFRFAIFCKHVFDSFGKSARAKKEGGGPSIHSRCASYYQAVHNHF